MADKTITDPDWAAEIEDVEPLKKKDNYRIHKDAYEVESFDDLEIREARPNFSKPNDFLENVVETPLPSTKEPFVKKERALNLFAGARASINHQTFLSLRKGGVPYEAKLDLHGFKEEPAWSTLMDFLRKSYSASLRCVLVVHGKGKGYGEGGEMGIIKASICGWLESSPAVLAYHTAQPKHGASGAVYVLIRRNKQKEMLIEEEIFG